MKTRFALLAMLAFALAAAASAESKVSGTMQCQSQPPSAVPVGDAPNHAFAIIKSQCTWPKPIEIAGVAAKDGDNTNVTEMTGDTAADRGYFVGTMANGDKIHVKFNGTSRSKDGKPVSGQGTWSFTGGTGKFEGLKGKGTYKGTANPDGTISYKIDGESSM
jgi:hypothetical protein